MCPCVKCLILLSISQPGTSASCTRFRGTTKKRKILWGMERGACRVSGETWQGSYYLSLKEEDGKMFPVGGPAYGEHGSVIEHGSLEEGSGPVMLEEHV